MNERPRKVTYAGWMATAACALVVLSLFDAMSRLRSVETQQAVRKALTRSGWLGVDVDQVLGVMHGLVLVSGALAAAGIVLAVFTLQRHRGARLGLTVVAVLLMLVSWTLAGLLPLVVLLAATMLWTRESRLWFDGRDPEPQPAGPGPGADAGPDRDRSAASWFPPSANGPSSGPAAPTSTPPAAPPAGPPAGPPPWAPPATGASPWQPAAPPPRPTAAMPGPVDPWVTAQSQQVQRVQRPPRPRDPDRRPAAVAVAAWLTWVFCAVTAVCFVLVVALVLAAPDQLLSRLQQEPGVTDLDLSGDDLLALLWVTSAVVIFWSLAAIALAVLAYRRVRLAHVALVVSAAASGVVGLVAVPVGWPNAVAALASAVLLCLPASRRWFARRGTGSGP